MLKKTTKFLGLQSSRRGLETVEYDLLPWNKPLTEFLSDLWVPGQSMLLSKPLSEFRKND